MTLTELKEKILEQINILTIDDFYSDPQLDSVKQKFTELTKLKTDDEFEKFLVDKFSETNANTLRLSLNKSISDLSEEIAIIEKSIQSSQKTIEKLNDQVSINKEQQADLPEQLEKIKTEIIGVENEIKQIKPLASKPPYDKQMVQLEKEKEKKNKEINNYPSTFSKLIGELENNQRNIKSEKEIIKKKQSEINSIKKLIDSKQKELVALSKKDATHFTNEYTSLEFLFKVLLCKDIKKEVVYREVETGEKYWNEWAKDYRYITKSEKTDDLKLVHWDIEFSKVLQYISQLTISDDAIPKDWRNILYQIFLYPVTDLAGKILQPKSKIEKFFTREKFQLSHIDTSALLAIKIASRSNHSLRTADNKIVLGLSGGLSASISFRKKGSLINKFQNQPIEIFSKCLSYEKYVYQTLYYQEGYANSRIEVATPGEYYILTKEYIIEIKFNAAPILFDNNSIVKFAPNISGKAKRKAEIKEAEDEEEERRLRREEDDYYD